MCHFGELCNKRLILFMNIEYYLELINKTQYFLKYFVDKNPLNLKF